MAATDYVEKLPVLYDEFAEAEKFPGAPLPEASLRLPSADALMRNTPGFWEHFVLPKINDDFRRPLHVPQRPVPGRPELFLQRIEGNIARLRQRLAATVPAA